MRYYLIAGEASGDLHGSNLIRGIRKADSGAVFRFWGGDKMAEAGGAENLAMHYKKASFMGFTEAGIDVYFENETPKVGDVAELIAQGKVEKMTADNTCHH